MKRAVDAFGFLPKAWSSHWLIPLGCWLVIFLNIKELSIIKKIRYQFDEFWMQFNKGG